MSVGYTNKKIFTSVPRKKGIVVYVGAKTGRDGIGGAIMASEEFAEGEDKRPTVQVGDPFYEKLLLEASLELFETGSVIAAQDMGAAGLTSSTTEVAIKGNYGIEIDLSEVPLREEGMEPWEILLSESQERMLFVLDFEALINKNVSKIFEKWDLDCFILGTLTDTNNFVVKVKDDIACDIPLKALEAPVLERHIFPKKGTVDLAPFPPVPEVPDFNMNWVWEQYDSQVMGNTIHGLQKDPAIMRLPNSNKGIAITTMSNAPLCNHNPRIGVASIIETCYNKLKGVGAKPLGITNCLNFGNPENENVMYEFARTVLSMADTCKKLKFPVVSGNVSFYNETSGKGIMPTPVIGGVGLML